MTRFSTVLWASGGTTTGIRIPPEVVLGFDRGKRVPVVVTINGGHSYRSTVAVMGGEFLVVVSAENRAAAGIAAGDEIVVDLDVDDAPREVVVPVELEAALAADPDARAAWDRLAPSHRKQHVVAIDGAKSAETRARRVAKALEALRG